MNKEHMFACRQHGTIFPSLPEKDGSSGYPSLHKPIEKLTPMEAWPMKVDKERPVVRLPVPVDFRFEPNWNYLTSVPGECLYRLGNRRIYKALAIGQETVLMEIRADESKGLRIEFVYHSAPANQSANDSAIHYIREWLDLDTDLTPFYEMARKDPLLADPVQRFVGLRSVGYPDLFEAMCWAILGQQINLAFAYTLKDRFVKTYGRSVEWQNMAHWIFPAPQTVAALSVQDLTALQISARKAEYVIGVAELIADGKLSKEMLLETDMTTAERLLTSIRGVGHWTAHYVLMRCLRFPSAFPVGDAGLQNAIRHQLGLDRKPTQEEIRQLAKGWSGWEAYATFYLWRVLY